jgi:glycerol-3-phosphate dehydrogenase
MPSRARLLEDLAARPFDVLVVGAGITGAGVARDAVLRGLTVALIDKGDFANGTSSRSSRLIHGGVRYLEHGHLRLVFEASRERRRLLRLAPHLVRPLAFTWPVYSGQRLPVWKLAAGLTLYDLLSLFRNVARHRRLRPAEVLEHEPAVSAEGLRGGVRYFDAATDDARLALANVMDARLLGAITANHVALRSVEASTDGLVVARLEDVLAREPVELRTRLVVNASGPWSDDVRSLMGGAPASRVQGSKGVHIAVPRARVENRQAITLLHPRDGRVMFALPAATHTIVGTTDTFTPVSADDVRASTADVAYLLEAANRIFPDARLVSDDVVAAWAGIRPLTPTSGSSVAASREHAIARSDRTVTITGGKLTTYRVMARQVVDAVQQMLGQRAHAAATDVRALPGGDIDVPVALKEAMRVTTDAAHATHLVHAYGSAWRDVLAYCERDQDGLTPIVPSLPYRLGEMRWGVERELANTLGDLLIRRTHVAFETRDHGRSAARRVAELLGWDAAEVDRYDTEVTRIFAVDR